MASSKHRNKRLEHDGNKCCNCGAPATQVHHIVPEALGGLDTLTNLASLCDDCHSKVHGHKACNHADLTKAGLRRTTKTVGRPPVKPAIVRGVREARAEGKSWRKVAEVCGVSLATAYKYGTEQDLVDFAVAAV